MVPAAVCATLFSKWELTTYNTFSVLSGDLSTPSSLPLGSTLRGPWPHGATCCMVATDFLHPMEPQAFLPAGDPVDYANYIADPICDASCLTISHYVRCALNPE